MRDADQFTAVDSVGAPVVEAPTRHTPNNALLSSFSKGRMQGKRRGILTEQSAFTQGMGAPTSKKRTPFLRRAVWETWLGVEHSLCVVELKPEAHVTRIELVDVNTTERRMGQDGICCSFDSG